MTSLTILLNIDTPDHHHFPIVISTGEFSGEIHATPLVKALMNRLPSLQFSGMGSTMLAGQGVRVVCDYRAISVTGLTEVVKKIGPIFSSLQRMKEEIAQTKPLLLILVDFPGFNLRLARFARRQGIPVVYFIPPQIWAWREKRVRHIASTVDRVISILPFEEPFYRKHGVDSVYVGHPFAATVRPTMERERFFETVSIPPSGTTVTLMPGSRRNEVMRHMPVLMEIVDILSRIRSDISFVIPLADTIGQEVIDQFIRSRPNVKTARSIAHDALAYSNAAVVTSGSATLEAAILGVPTAVIYRISKLSFALAKCLVTVSYVSLPNLIAGTEVFPEYIQTINPQIIAEKVNDMIKDGRTAIEKEITLIRASLGGYDSYERAAQVVVDMLEQKYGTLS